jgi:hypothetical protein
MSEAERLVVRLQAWLGHKRGRARSSGPQDAQCAWQPRGSGFEQSERKPRINSSLERAGEGIRTLDVNLGKVALYH